MATAEKKTEKVARTVEVQEEVTTYTLVLTEEEAKALYRVTDFIGGVPSTSPRRHTDAIRAALREADVPWEQYPVVEMAHFLSTK